MVQTLRRIVWRQVASDAARLLVATVAFGASLCLMWIYDPKLFKAHFSGQVADGLRAVLIEFGWYGPEFRSLLWMLVLLPVAVLIVQAARQQPAEV